MQKLKQKRSRSMKGLPPHVLFQLVIGPVLLAQLKLAALEHGMKYSAFMRLVLSQWLKQNNYPKIRVFCSVLEAPPLATSHAGRHGKTSRSGKHAP